jgi:hypothetical protein
MSTIGKVLLGLALGATSGYAVWKRKNPVKPRGKAAKQPEEPALPKTELTINSIVYVTQGKEEVFRNRTIIFKAPIICDGTVTFENCVLTYQPEQPTGIVLKKNATLTMRNCKVICNLPDEQAVKRVHSNRQHLVAVESKAVISCYETEFLSCIRFLGPGDEAAVVLENCRLVDPINFCELGFNTRLDVLNSAIRFSRTSGSFPGIFSSFGFANIFNVKNCSIEGPQGGMDREDCPIFMIRGVEVEGCKFVGINSCIEGAKTVTRCEFRQCKQLISYGYGSPEGGAVISDCLFDDCENVISKLPRQSTVEKCRFVRCNDNLINNCGRFDAEAVASGNDVTVESCEFIVVTGHDCHFGVSLAFIRGANGCGSVVKNCIFDRVQLTQGFLIAGRVDNEKQPGAVLVENCDLQHWATQNDTGRLIQTHSDVCPSEPKDDTPVTVESVVITNCRGIDKIEQQGCAGESFAMTDHDKFAALLKRTRKRFGLSDEPDPAQPSQSVIKLGFESGSNVFLQGRSVSP